MTQEEAKNETNKLEKTLKGLEYCHDLSGVDLCRYCPYDGDRSKYHCQSKLMTDALELLKGYKPVKAYRLHGEKIIDGSKKVFTGQCTNCYCYLVEGWKACPVCGKAMEW